MISAVAALGDATTTSLSSKFSTSTKASSSQISSKSASLASSLTNTIQYSSSLKTQSTRSDSASTVEAQLSLSLSQSGTFLSSLAGATIIPLSSPSSSDGHASSSSSSGSNILASTSSAIQTTSSQTWMTTPSISSSKTSSSSSGTTGPSSSGSIKNQLFSSSGGTAASWSTETASSFSVRPTVTDSASSVPAVPDDFYDAQLSPATLTSNLARDVILTLSHDFANDIADRLSLGTCTTYDPRPSEPIIEKRQTLTRNPCAVARSKRGIASIGGGTPLFRALLNLPRTFPILVSPLNDDVQDISLYVMNLLAWKNVTEPAIEATSEVFYLLALKREMNEPNEGITVNTIMHYDIAQMGGPSPTIMSSVSSTAASTTQALSLTCPSNTFYEPVATIVVRFLDIHTFLHIKADSYSHSAAAPNFATLHQAQRSVDPLVAPFKDFVDPSLNALLIDA